MSVRTAVTVTRCVYRERCVPLMLIRTQRAFLYWARFQAGPELSAGCGGSSMHADAHAPGSDALADEQRETHPVPWETRLRQTWLASSAGSNGPPGGQDPRCSGPLSLVFGSERVRPERWPLAGTLRDQHRVAAQARPKPWVLSCKHCVHCLVSQTLLQTRCCLANIDDCRKHGRLPYPWTACGSATERADMLALARGTGYWKLGAVSPNLHQRITSAVSCAGSRTHPRSRRSSAPARRSVPRRGASVRR